MIKEKVCIRCRNQFLGHWNAEYCPPCRLIRRRERDRLRESRIKGSPVAEGKWRCPICGAFKDRHRNQCKTCADNAQRGNRNVNWKGGKSHTKQGHMLIQRPKGYNDGTKQRYILEHRYIYESVHGKLPEGYIIHHLNGQKDDNRLENLAALPRSAHSGSAVLNVFKSRIRQLEAQVKALQTQLQGNML